MPSRAARCPHSAASTLIHDGVDGLVCDPTPEALADAIRSLLTDPFRLALMRAAAMESAARWDWDRVTLAMERIYLEVAKPEESADARYRRLSSGLSVGLSPHLEARRAQAWAPMLTVLAVLVGLALILVATPIVGRGDYGQWLMTSRFYLGEPVPDYRDHRRAAAADSDVPGRGPAVRSRSSRCAPGVERAAPGRPRAEPVRGWRGSRSGAIAGVSSVAIGLLVTDRFLELFALRGGLLQAGSVMFTSFSVAAFVQAGEGPGPSPPVVDCRQRIACPCRPVARRSGTLAVPVGLAAAGIAASGSGARVAASFATHSPGDHRPGRHRALLARGPASCRP